MGSSLQRRDLSGIARPVGHQHDDLAFRLAGVQAQRGGRDGRADGGAAFLDGAEVAGVIEAEVLEAVAQPCVVQRDRTGRHRAAGESH